MAILLKTITTSAASVEYDTSFTGTGELAHNYLRITNTDGTNAVWIRWLGTAAAVAEADENLIIRIGETVNIPAVDKIRVIAVGGTPKLNIWAANRPYI